MISKLRHYIAFTKPGISRAQILTVSIGYFLASQSINLQPIYWYLLVATYCFSSASCGLNNMLEYNFDAKMLRTQKRALVTKDISYVEAGIVVFLNLVVAVFFVLKINLMTFFVSVLTALIYVGVYTPMKRVSWLNTYVGAIPGALPLLGGWVATGSPIHLAVVSLFLTLFCWQIPHFFALSIMYFDEYKAANFRMLPNQSGGIKATKRQMIIFTILMIISSVYPALIGFLGMVYFFGVIVLSGVFLFFILRGMADLKKNARKLFFLSIIYLPLWLLLILVDIVVS